MILIDTHTHLYLEEFDSDRSQSIQMAIDAEVKYMLLPDIDSEHTQKLLETCKLFPKNCFPMIGIHPTSVKGNYTQELDHVKAWLKKEKFYALGEIGIDLYWDKTFFAEQCEIFREQLRLALRHNLPVVIHSRNSLDQLIQIISENEFRNISGMFHCFPGNVLQAKAIINRGFKIGIGGVVTYKNSGMAKVVKEIGLEHIVLETDAPYLPPVPYRGKRNESAYIKDIAAFIAELLNCSIDKVAEITTKNAVELFKIPLS